MKAYSVRYDQEPLAKTRKPPKPPKPRPTPSQPRKAHRYPEPEPEGLISPEQARALGFLMVDCPAPPSPP